MATAALQGRWQVYESENLDEYMKAIGVSDEMLKVAAANLSVEAKMQHVISLVGDDWSIVTKTPKGDREVKFKLDEEIGTLTLDGRDVKQVTRLEGDRMVEEVRGADFLSVTHRYLESPDVMVTEFEGNGIKCTRRYNRIN